MDGGPPQAGSSVVGVPLAGTLTCMDIWFGFVYTQKHQECFIKEMCMPDHC